MPTDLLPTRTKARTGRLHEPLTPAVWLALGLHTLALGAVLGWSILHLSHTKHFGSLNPTAGSIQASMVSALPLPPRQPVVDHAVLASDNPNIAPTPPPPPEPKAPAPKPKAEAKPLPEPTPRKDDIPLNKPAATKPNKPAPEPKPQPAKPTPNAETRPNTPPRVPTPTPPTPKATTGETPGLQIPQSTTELKNGTATITVEERAFGDRYAYYVKLISQKVNQSRSGEDPDPPEAKGKRTVIRFTIDRDGIPIEAEVQTRSGSLALDRSALRAIQRIDGFGPLPAGDHLTVDFGFTDH